MIDRFTPIAAILLIASLAACGGQAADGQADARAELEAMLPAQIGGYPLTKQSVGEVGVAEMVAAVGAEPADLTVATAGSPDAGILIAAFKIEGVSGHEIVDAFQQQAAYDEVEIAGKQVLVFAAGGGVHLYATDDVAFQLHGDGPALKEALTKLP